jgi:hypothetical protein
MRSQARLPPGEGRSYTASMNRRAPALVLSCVLIALAAMLGACSSGGGAKTVTPTRQASPAATSSASATPSLGIRTLDLSKAPDVQGLIASTGGQYVQAGVIYADLTGDGIDEAVVPISSGGTLGDVAFVVLTPSDAGTKTLLRVTPTDGAGGLAVAVVDGHLVMTQPVYGPEDPNCCPSSLRKTAYGWDGAALGVQSVTTEANPSGGGKLTPGPPATAPQ